MSGAAPIPPGATIGILGGGQLGRMTALAAASLGYRTHVFSPEPGCPAGQVATVVSTASFDNPDALASFAGSVAVATFEFENVPIEAAEAVARLTPLRPAPRALAISQDRVEEKRFLVANGVPVAPWREIASPDGLAAALAEIGTPAVLKSARMGYDGKGQVRLSAGTDLASAWRAMGYARGVLEAFVPFACEISVVVARGRDGSSVAYDPSENRHRDHILDESVAPAAISSETAAEAQRLARAVAAALDLVGLVAVEMFVMPDGGLMANEIAPRPHNSGHWTMDACRTGQFEQLVRAICGLPLGAVERHADVRMKNLLGDAVDAWPEVLAEPDAKLHLYGKAQARPGRKMGHVNRLYPLGTLGCDRGK